jgi:hypothetical protein
MNDKNNDGKPVQLKFFEVMRDWENVPTMTDIDYKIAACERSEELVDRLAQARRQRRVRLPDKITQEIMAANPEKYRRRNGSREFSPQKHPTYDPFFFKDKDGNPLYRWVDPETEPEAYPFWQRSGDTPQR